MNGHFKEIVEDNTFIREIRPEEIRVLETFLYEAIFIPEGSPEPPRSIIENEDLQVYVRDFGKKPDDRCLVAEVDGKIVGAVWTRIMDDYGHIDNQTPSMAISLYREYRNRGIGTQLMRRMLEKLKADGYKSVSLSVQKANYALQMYRKVGFTPISDHGDELLMVCPLKNE
jgi:ribosomal protein S18 acetylase RimI-like enzyme